MEQSPPRKYSVFLSPAEEDYAYCDRLITGVCAKYDISPFEPHLTLHSVILDSPDILCRAVAAAARGLDPLRLRVRGVGSSDEYFKTLFIAFEEDETLMALHRVLRERFPDSGYRLMPHLSLLYHEMPLKAKQALARRVRIDRESLLFDTVKVVTPGNDREGWRDTGRWQTIWTVKLGKEVAA